MSLMKLIPTTLAVLAASTVVASARDQLQIAGSSTVLPYATKMCIRDRQFAGDGSVHAGGQLVFLPQPSP